MRETKHIAKVFQKHALHEEGPSIGVKFSLNQVVRRITHPGIRTQLKPDSQVFETKQSVAFGKVLAASESWKIHGLPVVDRNS